MKRIVVYYSLEGNTKQAAERLAGQLQAELLEIRLLKEIPKEGGKKFMIGGMQATFGICPKLSDTAFDLASYDEIILGTPVWEGKCAPAIRSFIKKNHPDDKVVAVFTCSGGGDNAGCISDLEKMLHHIRFTASLTDQKNQTSSENDEKLQKLADQIIGK